MQPVKLTIYGNFWDSQIYKGRLYLWDMDNALHIYDWDALVESMFQDDLELPLTCAFLRSDLLYQFSDLNAIFRDPQVHKVVREKLEFISQRGWAYSLHDIENFRMGKQDSPFDTLHDDSAIYYNNIYALTDSGLYLAGAHKPIRYVYKVERKPEKLWDGLGTSIQVSGGTLAIAAADEGLFQLSLWDSNEPEPVSDRYTLFANWAFASIYGSSDLAPGYLAAFSWHRFSDEAASPDRNDRWIRKHERIIDEEEIFGFRPEAPRQDGSLSWGSQEKLYLVNSSQIHIVRFKQKYVSKPDGKNIPFEHIGSIDLTNSHVNNMEQAIGGGVEFFGLIVEYPENLLVATSNDEFYVIQGPITQWRVFPRSVRYENHLHVISDDRIDIYSFNDDYLIDQRSKKAGIEYSETRSRQRMSDEEKK